MGFGTICAKLKSTIPHPPNLKKKKPLKGNSTGTLGGGLNGGKKFWAGKGNLKKTLKWGKTE